MRPCANKPPAKTTQPKAETDLITEIGGCSDTYSGSVSEEAYKEEGDAAEAFVRNEILGSDDQTQVTVAEPQTVTKDEAEKIIPAEFTKDAVEFKKVEVTYGDSEEASTRQFPCLRQTPIRRASGKSRKAEKSWCTLSSTAKNGNISRLR